jgi:hypothetical protein
MPQLFLCSRFRNRDLLFFAAIVFLQQAFLTTEKEIPAANKDWKYNLKKQ